MPLDTSIAWVVPKEGPAGRTLRVELYIDAGEKAHNNAIFDYFKSREKEIESQIGMQLTWDELEDRQACRISVSKPFRLISATPEQAEEVQSWGTSMMLQFIDVFTPYIRAIPPQLLDTRMDVGSDPQ